MLDYYTTRALSGNSPKVSIMLAETALPHEVHFIDLDGGEQRSAWYTAIQPDGKIPAIMDHDVPGGLALGESGAILIHLAERTGQFLPTAQPARSRVLQWLFWQVGGVGPMFGQWWWFANAAPDRLPTALARYQTECARLLGVFDKQLGCHRYAAGEYSVADMALFPWVAPGYAALQQADPGRAAPWGNLRRWLHDVAGRPAVQHATTQPESSALRLPAGNAP